MLVNQGGADIFLTYCTNALDAVKEYPGQRMIALPDNLAVGADYGLTVITTASPALRRPCIHGVRAYRPDLAGGFHHVDRLEDRLRHPLA